MEIGLGRCGPTSRLLGKAATRGARSARLILRGSSIGIQLDLAANLIGIIYHLLIDQSSAEQVLRFRPDPFSNKAV